MNSLFNPHRLALKLTNQPNFIASQQVAIFKNWHHLLSTTDKTEEQLQADFLNDIFGEILGYKYKRGEFETNLEKEQTTELDGKQPDGILGFFTLNKNKEKQDVRVIIELKGYKANLDARQNRDSKQTPVEQAFSYVSKYQKVEFVIVSNFKEIRLYQSNYQGKYQQFFIADLVHNNAKQQEFYFLLCKNNLIGLAPHTGSVIKQFIENETKHETEIKNKFYFEYKAHRQDFVTDILKQNSFSASLAIDKTQKLFDRLLFVRFCEDNNLLHKPFEKVYTGWALGLSLFDSLKTLFKSIDQGNPPHIHKFNGGLFAFDAEFDGLKINHDLLKKFIYFLRLYHFKNDLSVHILGHIFEQSLTDLQHLKASLNNSTHNTKEGKRKKDGIFYTPENITKYIVAKALGGWLKEQKDALQLSDFIFHELPENKPKKWQNPNQELIDRYKLYAKKLQEVKVLDPACGSGAFLIEVFNYLQNEWLELSQTLQKLGEEPEFGLFNYQNIYKSILQNNIYGVDINSESVQITKLSLWLKTANSQDSLTSLDNNIKIGNSLIADSSIDEKAFNWQQEFNFKFDVVVGNPPYVRQELFSSIKPYLQQNYSVYAGMADLYCYFYEKATQLLAPNGRLGFITSNKWMRANYGFNLRKFILANTKIQDFIDLGGQEIFKGVGVDANILLYQKTQTTDDYVFCVGDNLSNFSEFASNHLDANCFNIGTNNLARSIKTKIETLGVPLKNWDVKINYGIKTGFNEAFIIDTKIKEELCLADAKSAEIIKPILRGRDIARYSTKWAGLWVIGTFPALKIKIENYPAIENYLKRFGKKLEQTGESYFDENGNQQNARKKTGNKWFETQDQIAYYEEFEKEKIIWQEMTNKPCFYIDKSNNYVSNTGYVITVEQGLQYLLVVLNSNLIDFYMQTISSSLGKEGKRWTKQYVEQLPIPQISSQAQQSFVEKAQQMLDLNLNLNKISDDFLDYLKAKMQNPAVLSAKLNNWQSLNDSEFLAEITKLAKQQKLTSFDDRAIFTAFKEDAKKSQAILLEINQTNQQIDAMVYELYSLSPQEIALIQA